MPVKEIIGYKAKEYTTVYLCPDCAMGMKRDMESFAEGEEEPCTCDNCGEVIEERKYDDCAK